MTKKEQPLTEKEKKKMWCWWWWLSIFAILCLLWIFTYSPEETQPANTPTMIIEQVNESWEVEQVEIDVPREYLNALKKAQLYSDSQYMSEKRIYTQLTSEYWEWFTKEAADYAIANLNADYNRNALMKWKSYYEHQSMSKQRVYTQLTSDYWEWFTAEQAQYAIDHLED